MNEWFKYEFGFVNIDDSNIYFTNTGNWSETAKLKEKTKNTAFRNKVRRIKIGLFLTVSFILFLVLFVNNILSSRVSLWILIGLPLAALSVYKYLQTEIGPAFKIPISKINSIELEEDVLSIDFQNGNDETDYQRLEKVEAKGIKIIHDWESYK